MSACGVFVQKKCIGRGAGDELVRGRIVLAVALPTKKPRATLSGRSFDIPMTILIAPFPVVFRDACTHLESSLEVSGYFEGGMCQSDSSLEVCEDIRQSRLMWRKMILAGRNCG